MRYLQQAPAARLQLEKLAYNLKYFNLGGSICFDEMMCADKIEIYDTVENTVYEKRIQHHVNVNFASAVLV